MAMRALATQGQTPIFDRRNRLSIDVRVIEDFGDPCVFLVGWEPDHNRAPGLVLKANSGKLWCQTDGNPAYVMATEDDVTDAHCLFKLIKV
jgi:hypothetical protein